MPEAANKAVVERFNAGCIARCDMALLDELLDPAFVNHTAMPGLDLGIAGMRVVFEDILHRGLSGIRVEIEQMIAEGDRVATRKRILGRHTGDFLGVAATGRDVEILVHDVVRLRNGRYLEHWGMNTIPQVAASLRSV